MLDWFNLNRRDTGSVWLFLPIPRIGGHVSLSCSCALHSDNEYTQWSVSVSSKKKIFIWIQVYGWYLHYSEYLAAFYLYFLLACVKLKWTHIDRQPPCSNIEWCTFLQREERVKAKAHIASEVFWEHSSVLLCSMEVLDLTWEMQERQSEILKREGERKNQRDKFLHEETKRKHEGEKKRNVWGCGVRKRENLGWYANSGRTDMSPRREQACCKHKQRYISRLWSCRWWLVLPLRGVAWKQDLNRMSRGESEWDLLYRRSE